MQVNPDVIKALVPKLRERQSIPPREAVFALLALAGEKPDELITLCPENKSWLLLALTPTGLVIVEVDFGSEKWWSWEHDRRADDATVAARWFPLSAVNFIEADDLRVYQGGFMDTALELQGMTGYAVHIDGRGPIRLGDPTEREGAAMEFVRTLQGRLR